MAKRVLAVDDEPHMLILLERILRGRTPYEVTTTSSALEVPRLLETSSFDVIVCDMKMPGMSGLDLLRKINSENRRELVIFITAFGTLESALEAVELGVFDYLAKPFKKEQLLQSLERAMGWQEEQVRNPEANLLLDAAPFEFASDVFRIAWVRQLADKIGDDITELARRTNLNEELIRRSLHTQGGSPSR